MARIYFNEWAKENYQQLQGRKAMLADFDISEEGLRDFSVIAASYEESNYEGDAIVLLERDGVPYLVFGSHCSCFGLEGQWELERTSGKALKQLLENHSRLQSDTWSYHGDQFVARLRRYADNYQEAK